MANHQVFKGALTPHEMSAAESAAEGHVDNLSANRRLYVEIPSENSLVELFLAAFSTVEFRL